MSDRFNCLMQTQTPPNASPEPLDSTATLMLDVSGMKCAGCVRAVENQLLRQSGVIAATVNLITETAMVEYVPDQVDVAALTQHLTDTGFPTQLRYAPGETEEATGITPAEKQQQEVQRRTRQVMVAAVLLVLSVLGHLGQAGWLTTPGLGNIYLHGGLATLALLFPGRPILVDGWRGLRHNMPNMNTLVGLGTLTAYTASLVALFFPQLGWECFFDEPVMLVGFILLGRALEQQARARATQSLQSLVALQPTMARLVKPDVLNGQAAKTIEIPASRVKVGEWLQVLPGDKIPVDGEIVAGQTTVNEAMLTGEAIPVARQVGEAVTGGSLNLSGQITVKATRTGQNTTLAQIIHLVETAQTRKAPIQGLADTVAGYFTYGVMTLALLTFLFWYGIGLPLWGDQIFAHWPTMHHLMNHSLMHHGAMHSGEMQHPSPLLLSLKLAIAVLVIACPCALGLATPTAILVGSSLGAERGLLIRGGDVLEKMHQLQTVVFDKTGTLTLGQPVVTDCLPLHSDWSAARLLQFAATMESGTQHPLGLAVQQAAAQQELSHLAAENFHTEAGYGISATVADQAGVLGTADWLQQQGVELPVNAVEMAEQLAHRNKTPIYIAAAGELVGLIAVQDQVRPEAQTTIEHLHQMGLTIKMLTGDQASVATAVAQTVKLDETDVFARVLPDQKASVIQQLQQTGGRVAMVGDGINDAPALAQADIGIALNSGTEVAIETADIILVRNQLQDVVDAIRLSQATFNKIRQNLFWAFIYNLLGIPVAAGVLLPFGIILSPATAGALMAFSSVSVVTNSLLLRRTFKA